MQDNFSNLPSLRPGLPAWREDDAAALRAFLVTSVGDKFTRQLQSMRPVVSKLDRDARLIQSDTRAGYEECLSDLIFLAEPQAVTALDLAAQTRAGEAPSVDSQV